MVSIVIVSHSAKLAEGVKELAEQMVQGAVALATAGGIDDPDNPIGTDPIKVHEAIQSVYSEDGVVVLMDLGSALLSAEMALEFLAPEQRANVHLCEAPLVEGSMAAAVQAMVGGSAQEVMAEARSALAAKESQLQPLLAAGGQPAPAKTDVVEELDGSHELELTVRNRLGLHARPAARFVSRANRFEAAVWVEKAGQRANAKSINQVATLGVRQGDVITIIAAGADAEQALRAIQSLADENFGDVEEGEAVTATPPTLPDVWAAGSADEATGIAASPGFAVGPAVHYRPRLPEVITRSVADSEAEWQRLQQAVARAEEEIVAVHRQAVTRLGQSEADIFEAHRLFLQDPALVEEAKGRIVAEQINAEAAWERVIQEMAGSYRALEETYMQARAADVLDVGRRVLRQLMDLEPATLALHEPSILLASDLTPSDTAGLDPAVVLGICTELGGATSHSAILARALGIPAVVGLGPIIQAVEDGQVVAVDGGSGKLWLRPDAERLARLEAQRAEWSAAQQEAKARAVAPAVTVDGHRLEIGANIGGIHDVAVALSYGAEGIGLFRTEFLFLDRQTAPSEEEQLAAYRQVVEAMGERPVIIRTLDVGGDKPLPYVDLGREENPFLGWRGIRFCLDRPEIFRPQLRAALRAGHGHQVKLMFPMIGALSELRAAKALLFETRQELEAEGLAHASTMEVGIMVEVPSAVAVADQLAQEADFFSIGTNDLTQYVMAADRGNTRVADLAVALQPAVLRMVKQTVSAAHSAGIWVGMCGELAGNARAAAVLVGLGLDELSMSAPSIPAVKEAIRSLTLEQARQAAEAVLALDSAEAVQEYLAAYAS
jgi:multiphosphoryl transfer protein